MPRTGPGRSRDWLKFKCDTNQEFVIGGYTDPQRSRIAFGALLLGYYDADGKLAYAGKVGTGFDTKTLRSLLAELDGDGQDRRRSTGGPAPVRRALGAAAAWWPRSGSPSGPGTASSAIPGSRACAATRPPPRWSGRYRRECVRSTATHVRPPGSPSS